MDILEQLEALVRYYGSTGNIGHRTLMMEGVENSIETKCILLAENMAQARRLRDTAAGIVDIVPMGMDGLKDGVLVGKRCPLAIDHIALRNIFARAAERIRLLETKLEEKEMYTIKLPSGKVFSSEYMKNVFYVDEVYLHNVFRSTKGKETIAETVLFQWVICCKIGNMADFFKMRGAF